MHGTIAAAVQKVELVGGESWFEHNSVAIAAITAAVLAALVAIVNRRAQLTHDREMRNRDHIRDTIDSAIDVANQTRTVMNQFLSLLDTVEGRRVDPEADLAESLVKSLLGLREKTIASIRLMASSHTRLAIRLEEDDPVTVSYKGVLSAFIAVFKHTHLGVTANRPSATCVGDSQRDEELALSFREFQNACRSWFNG